MIYETRTRLLQEQTLRVCGCRLKLAAAAAAVEEAEVADVNGSTCLFH